MVHSKNRLFNSLTLFWHRENDNSELEMVMGGVGILLFIIIIVLLIQRCKDRCCCRHHKKNKVCKNLIEDIFKIIFNTI